MSQTVDLRWELEQRRRREAYLDRIQGNVETFRHRYQSKFDELINQGLEEFMPQEFAELRSNLNRLARLSSSDPEQARDLSFQVGEQLSRLPRLARSARNEFAERERQQRKELAESRRQASTALTQFIQDIVADITDPIELDFAYEDIRSIQEEYAGRIVEKGELSTIQSNIKTRMSTTRKLAREKASAWKEDKINESKESAAADLIDLYKEQAKVDAKNNPKAMGNLLNSLDELRSQVEMGTSIHGIQETLTDAIKQADDEVVDETCRRKVVRSIMDSLEETGFVVSKPKRSKTENDEVIITARKPAGSEASFRVSSNGSMIYKFDHYEGVQCKDDIQRVLPLLKDIYGVNLSQERTLWENPDKISKSAKPLSGGNEGVKNG